MTKELLNPIWRKNQNEDLSSKFLAGTSVKKYNEYTPEPAKREVPLIIKLILDRFLIPWFLRVLTKYSYEQFHGMMMGYHHDEKGRVYAGRDFIADFRQNHTQKWNWFIKYARDHRDSIQFDVPHYYEVLTTNLIQRGWPLTEHEKKGLYQTLMRIYRLIYD